MCNSMWADHSADETDDGDGFGFDDAAAALGGIDSTRLILPRVRSVFRVRVWRTSRGKREMRSPPARSG
jgi:hypothetical protein